MEQGEQTVGFLKEGEKDITIKRESEEDASPADGGTRAWLVMLGSFFCNGILFGVINSYGVLFNDYHQTLIEQKITNPSGNAGECLY